MATTVLTISQLAAAVSVNASDLLPVTQGATNPLTGTTVKMGIGQMFATPPPVGSFAANDTTFTILGKPAVAGGDSGSIAITTQNGGVASGAGSISITVGDTSAPFAGGGLSLRAGLGGFSKTGGPLTGVGGAGTNTGTGGAVAFTAGASGAGITGAGGAFSGTGGAALSTNGAGGGASLTGGAGKGSGNGGNITLTPGVAGLTGAAGQIVLQGTASMIRLSQNSTITSSNGAVSVANSMIFATPFFNGTTNASTSAGIRIAASDRVFHWGANSWNMMFLSHAPGGAGFSGDRSTSWTQVNVGAALDPGSDRVSFVPVTSYGFASVNVGGRPGKVNSTTYQGSMWGGLSHGQLKPGATNWIFLAGHEIDYSVDDPAAAPLRGVGLNISQQPNHRARATTSDIGLLFGQGPLAYGVAPGWLSVLSLGDPTQDSPSWTDTTFINIQPRIYGALNQTKLMYGIDFRAGTFTSGGAGFAMRNAAISDLGAIFGHGITTDGVVQAQTATLTGATINDGGVYVTTWPTLTVQAPPSGGTTATLVVATMGAVANGATGAPELSAVVSTSTGGPFGSIGKGYTVGNTLTYPSGAPAVGTLPTFTVGAVDANGGITLLTLASNGALTASAPNPLYLTGGTGTGAAINVVSTDTSSGFFIPQGLRGAVTGSLYQVGDILTAVGDTGTPVKFAVASVDSFGGILTVTVNDPGSVTAISGASYHSFTGGSGTGASIAIGYTILTLTNGAGSGYLPFPQPLVNSSLTDFKVAKIVPVMTAANADLSLNPSGGSVKFGSGVMTANGSVATAMSSLGPAGAHTTIQEWLAVKNASGVIRYIPAF